MSAAPPAMPAVTLENCDREPIHVPGAIQSHGALLTFDADWRVCHASANAAALLGPTAPVLGQRLDATHFAGCTEALALLHEVAATPVGDTDIFLQSCEVQLHGQLFDLVAHRSGAWLVAEFEQRPASDDDVAGFALRAHRAMDRLKRQPHVDALLALATRVLRELTGFDRVMAYRFREDDSGEVVAEDKHDALEPFVGQRYPASDIPAQARRLYLLNTLRLIADMHAEPVPVLAIDASTGLLDMSHGVLRSVSPIHVEYLRNMGVGASMSISIVIGGRLWGMLACHHRTARRVPYSVRMACDVLAQVLGANVQTLLAREQAEWAQLSAQLRSRLVEGVLHSDSTVAAIATLAEPLMQAFGADALLAAEEARLFVHGALPHAQAQSLLQWVQAQPVKSGALVETQALPQHAPELEAAVAGWCGVLALRFDEAGGLLVLLRREQIETIRWGGKPEKQYTIGPLGPRLTPRGSFNLWLEEVRGTCLPWTEPQRELARQLWVDLSRANAAQLTEHNRARTQLLAMLGHDLRDPLQSISMAAKVLERSSEGEGARSASGARLGQRIQSSSSRMARLIGQVLDASRLQTGLGLQLQPAEVDLARVLEDLLDEARTGHPGLSLVTELPPTLPARADADRVAQLFANLISNARHHGAPGEAVIVQLSLQGSHVSFEVSNSAPPIPQELVPHLFSAFKRQTPDSRNRSGLGLGLHIARAIALSHGGTLDYVYAEPYVVFSARFPVRRPDAD